MSAKIATIDRYIATSGETKPASPRNGSELIETNTGAIYVYDGAAWQIHEGEHFTATYTETVGTGTSVTVMITAPTTTARAHLVYSVQASNSLVATWSESPGASGGSAITSYNNERNSSTTALSVLKSAITFTSVGTTLQNILLGGSNSPHERTGGGSGSRQEWILASSGTYLMKADADNASTKVTMEFYYYEE